MTQEELDKLIAETQLRLNQRIANQAQANKAFMPYQGQSNLGGGQAAAPNFQFPPGALAGAAQAMPGPFMPMQAQRTFTTDYEGGLASQVGYLQTIKKAMKPEDWDSMCGMLQLTDSKLEIRLSPFPSFDTSQQAYVFRIRSQKWASEVQWLSRDDCEGWDGSFKKLADLIALRREEGFTPMPEVHATPGYDGKLTLDALVKLAQAATAASMSGILHGQNNFGLVVDKYAAIAGNIQAFTASAP